MSLLRVENLTKVFGPRPRRGLALFDQGLSRDQIRKKTGLTLGIADVSFEVQKGEIMVIMGLSGSGKSTLVRCINRLIEPTRGRITIDGEDVVAMNRDELLNLRRHRVSMVFQGFALFPHRTVVDNASYGLEVMGVARKKRRDKAYETLELVGLKGWEEHRPVELSGGMQQRVGLARALAVDPEIILMDEALSALDPLIRKDMQNELIDLQRKVAATIIFITHDLDEAINLGDHIVLMKDGLVVQKGTAEQILTNPASRYVERFVEDVDMSTVMTAESVMRKARDVAHDQDGPQTVLRKMRDAGLSEMFVVDSHNVLKGMVRAERVAERARQSGGDGAWFDAQIKTAAPDTTLQDLLPMMTDNRDPIAIIDDKRRLRGVVVIGALLSGLVEGAATS
jgi:glycine betaine/proline transport system ATP-binding protein